MFSLLSHQQRVSSGFVDFPIGNPSFENVGGSLVVKLVVIPYYDDIEQVRFNESPGASVREVNELALVGDDRCEPPIGLVDCSTVDGIAYAADLQNAWTARHLSQSTSDRARILSRDYLAVVVMGSAAWAGWNRELQMPWYCRYSDLNPAGRKLYEMMQLMHPSAELHLLTFMGD